MNFSDLIKDLIGKNLRTSVQCRFLRAGCLTMKIATFRTPMLIEVYIKEGQKIVKVSQGNYHTEYIYKSGTPIYYNSIQVSWFHKTFLNRKGSWYSDTQNLALANKLLNSWKEMLIQELNEKKATAA